VHVQRLMKALEVWWVADPCLRAIVIVRNDRDRNLNDMG